MNIWITIVFLSVTWIHLLFWTRRTSIAYLSPHPVPISLTVPSQLQNDGPHLNAFLFLILIPFHNNIHMYTSYIHNYDYHVGRQHPRRRWHLPDMPNRSYTQYLQAKLVLPGLWPIMHRKERDRYIDRWISRDRERERDGEKIKMKDVFCILCKSFKHYKTFDIYVSLKYIFHLSFNWLDYSIVV